MPIEVEQKYRLQDRDAVLAGITALGAVSQPAVTQVDRYYSHPERDFAVTDEALRIRRVGETNFITYKGPKLDATTKTRREIELPLAEGTRSSEQWDELLCALGFRRVAQVSKVRESFRLSRAGHVVEVVVDQVEGVGNFVEIEIVVASEAEVPAAQALFSPLASELQLAGIERRSYLEMLLG